VAGQRDEQAGCVGAVERQLAVADPAADQPIIIPAADKTFGEQQADPAAAEPKSLSHLGE